MKKKILVVGNGFMGVRISEYLSSVGHDVSLYAGRITTPAEVKQVIPQGEYDVVINAVGKTGSPNVDWCESHKPETYFANVHVPYLLAEETKQQQLRFVHLSSGCLYQGDNGEKGWSEVDAPNFEGSYYSHTKAVAERLLGAYDHILTLRLRMPIDDRKGSRELLGKLLRYEKLISVENSVTYIPQFLVILDALLRRDSVGTFNLTHPTPITHRQLLERYEEVSNQDLRKQYIPLTELDTQAPRSNCILNTEKIQAMLPEELFEVDFDAMMRRYIAS